MHSGFIHYLEDAKLATIRNSPTQKCVTVQMANTYLHINISMRCKTNEVYDSMICVACARARGSQCFLFLMARDKENQVNNENGTNKTRKSDSGKSDRQIYCPCPRARTPARLHSADRRSPFGKGTKMQSAMATFVIVILSFMYTERWRWRWRRTNIIASCCPLLLDFFFFIGNYYSCYYSNMQYYVSY